MYLEGILMYIKTWECLLMVDSCISKDTNVFECLYDALECIFSILHCICSILQCILMYFKIF
jgi:hypothetical protein